MMFSLSLLKIVSFLVFFNLPLGIANANVVRDKSNDLSREDDDKTPFTLEEYFSGYFSASSFNGTWLSDGNILFRKTDGHYYKFDVETKTYEYFLNGTFMSAYSGASMTLSPDETYVLIRYNVSSVYRHSTTASYAVYDINATTYYDINDKMPVQLATFDTAGHGFVYVYLNNIYYLSSVLDENPVNVTDDGVEGIIYNGVPDWVYEEEVLGSGSALWFSPDGKHLAYAKFNDTNVEDFFYFIYGTAGDIEDQYPTLREIKYPKVGQKNPVVETYVYSVETGISTKLSLLDSIQDSEEVNDYVLYDITWLSDSELAMISSNRVQNESIIIRCTLDGNCEEEVSYSQANGWLSPEIPKYSDDGASRLQILPQAEGDDQYNHLVLTTVSSNTAKRLTFGDRVVTSIYGWDQENHLVYYVGSANDTPSQQQVSVVNTETLEDKCLTCDYIVDDENCKYASGSFNSPLTYFIKTCQGPNPYYVVLQSLTNESDVFIWTENLVVRERLALKSRFSERDLKVPLSSNFTARVRLTLPPNFDENQKYPAVVYVYAGPNSNQINDAFSSGVINYFVTNRTYIYIMIDARGCGRSGQNIMFQIYRKMGTVEIEDQIEVTKYLQDTYSFIDRDRTGIWGWSYGGFASTWALIKDKENVFKFGLAVAPVTSFIYYDTIYTERYMGLPTEEDNVLGYNNTDTTRNVEALRGKLYYIIHGNADDNVHYQNAMFLVKALEEADISFLQQSYPDENHSLTYVYKHLYHTMDKFWARAFGVEGPALSIW